ncbi:transposon Tf2-6 polyprotein, partial [Trichonephila clavipes]
MAFLLSKKKEHLIELAEELGLIVKASLTKPKKKDLIVKSPNYVEEDVKQKEFEEYENVRRTLRPKFYTTHSPKEDRGPARSNDIHFQRTEYLKVESNRLSLILEDVSKGIMEPSRRSKDIAVLFGLGKELFELISNYEPKKTETTSVSLRIVLKDDIAVYQSARRLAFSENQDVNKQIDEWLEQGIVRLSSSEYASPIVLVKKKDGTTRLCVDYIRLNRKLVKDRFPLPLIEDVLSYRNQSVHN